MRQKHKYAYQGKSGLILTDARPGGKQWDHVTAYGLFKERLRILETEDPDATLSELMLLITTMRNNHDKLISAYTKSDDSTIETEQPKKSSRILIQEAKQILSESQAALETATNRINATKTKNKKNEHDQSLVDFKLAEANLKIATNLLKAAESRAPVKNELDGTIDEMLSKVDYLAKCMLSTNEIKVILKKEKNKEQRNRLALLIENGKQKTYDDAITELANIYLIFKNKQQYSAFSIMGSIPTLKGEAKRISNAMAKLREIELSQGNNPLEDEKTEDVLSAVKALFWYPKIPKARLIGGNPKKLADFRKNHPKSIEPRSNDLQIAAFVIAEHLEVVFACYPRFNPELRTVLTKKFIESFSISWDLKQSEEEDISEVIKSYLIDEESATSSVTPSSQSLASSGQLDTSDSSHSANMSSSDQPLESNDIESTSSTIDGDEESNKTETSSSSEYKPTVKPTTTQHDHTTSSATLGMFSPNSKYSTRNNSSTGHKVQQSSSQQIITRRSGLGKRSRNHEPLKPMQSQKEKIGDKNFEATRKKR